MMKNVIPMNDIAVTAVIDFITFVKEIGGTGNGRHLLEAWLIQNNLQYSGAVYRPVIFNKEKQVRRPFNDGSVTKAQLMQDLLRVLDKYAGKHDEIEEALVAADRHVHMPSSIRQGNGRFGVEEAK